MHAYLLIGEPPLQNHILEKLAGYPINEIETYPVIPNPSHKIAAVRDIIRYLSTHPIKKIKVVLIQNAHLLTLPAQNALLKTLEEPPVYAKILLITPFKDALLPTILSRVVLHPLAGPMKLSPPATTVFSDLESASIPERLMICQSYTTKEKVDNLILSGLHHYQTILTQNPHAPLIIKLLHQAQAHLKANVSPLLTLEHIALHLPTSE